MSADLDGLSVPFDELPSADLVVDRVYRGGSRGSVADDPLSKLLPVGNQGGFRYWGKRDAPRLVVLYTSGVEPDWPDVLDPASGAFTYFGDNRHPGKELHDSSRGGNVILRRTFDFASSAGPRPGAAILALREGGQGPRRLVSWGPGPRCGRPSRG